MAQAGVFISCGQSSDVERDTASAIANELVTLGFNPYVAVQQSTLRGLKENIFAQLEDSEYLLFVDFQREPLSSARDYRGSLFSHQELAIASYLDLEFMGFRQVDVRLEGVLSFLQGNCLPFSDPRELPDLVKTQATKLGWKPDWNNKLTISRDPSERDTVLTGSNPTEMGSFFHLKVSNVNRRKTALGCRAYVTLVSSLGTDDPRPKLSGVGRPVELKWAGYTFPDVIIPPTGSRDLDIGLVLSSSPNVVTFPSFSDSSLYNTSLIGPGRFVVQFVVVSENFPMVQASVKITLGTRQEDAQLELV